MVGVRLRAPATGHAYAPPMTGHPSRRRASRMVVVLVAASSLVLAGCGDGDDDAAAPDDASTTSPTTDGTTTSTDATTTSSDTSTTTTTATTEPPATTAPTTTPAAPFDGSIEPVAIPRPASTTDVVAHLDLAVDAGDEDARISFRFDGALPGVDVRYVDRPILEDGSGNEVAVEGQAVLSIRFEPAVSARFEGEEIVRTYTGEFRVDGAGPVTELVRIGDFESVYEWAAGLTDEVPFRVDVDEATSTVTVVVPPT